MLLKINPLHYKGGVYILITPIRFIEQLAEKLTPIEGRRWERGIGWYIPYEVAAYDQLRAIFGKANIVVEAQPVLIASNSVQAGVLTQAAEIRLKEQLMVNRYSPHTRKNYLSYFRMFLAHFKDRDLDGLQDEDVKQFILKQVEERRWSESAQNTCINAIKFYYEKVLGRNRTFYALRAKKSEVTPYILSEDEVRRLFQAVENIKHKCILLVIYSAGLRLSEVVNLRLDDMLWDRRQIFVKAGKGKKDRYTLLSEKAVDYLQKYIARYRPQRWLFEGINFEQYSVRSVQNILKRAVEKSNVNSHATVHTLRHSFATHLLDKGISLRHIQDLLGHDSIKTTERYLHITDSSKQKLKSPLDDLDI